MAVKFWVDMANGTKSLAVDCQLQNFFFDFTLLVDGEKMVATANITAIHI